MTFEEFLNQAWGDHATQSQQVAARLADGFRLIQQTSQIPQMALLVTHVFGEHLGQWDEGIRTLQLLRQIPAFNNDHESEQAIARSIVSLEIAGEKRTSIDELSVSDQIRVLAVASSALSEQRNAEKAQILFQKALGLAKAGLSKEDPANRALAVTGNSLACALEEKSSRTPAEIELMILAAKTGRKYWEIAGTWLQVERAEYRLSQTYLKAGDFAQSLDHALASLEIIVQNQAPALEFFFAYEAVALVEKAQGNQEGYTNAREQVQLYFEKLDDNDKSWCRTTLDKLA
jgi:hypothetical protein